jgi:hypothetical protein
MLRTIFMGLSAVLVVVMATGVASAQESDGNRRGGPLAPGACIELDRMLRGGARFDGQLCRDSNSGQSASSYAGEYTIRGVFVAVGDVNGDGVADRVTVQSHLTVYPSDPTGNTYYGHNFSGVMALGGEQGSFSPPSSVVIDAGTGNDVLRAFADRTLGVLIALLLP